MADAACGRVKDIYFDDRTWQVRYLVAAIGVQRQIEHLRLITPERLRCGMGGNVIHLPFNQAELNSFPTANEIKPVCKQYAALSCGSPHSRPAALDRNSDPHLRSWATVSSYSVEYDGQKVGGLHNAVIDLRSASIRYLQIAEETDGRTLHFQLLPSAVERISWAAERIFLHYLQPVQIGVPAEVVPQAESADFLAA